MKQLGAIQRGDILTDRHGRKCLAPAMTFSAPFWIYEQGVATANYGDDEAAAFAHYDHLVHERRVLMHNLTPTVLPIARRSVAAPACRAQAEGVPA